MVARTSKIDRRTAETNVSFRLDLDGSGTGKVKMPVPFMVHMLDQIVRFSNIDLELDSEGDIEIDDHHITEDIGIVFGQALRESLGNKKGVKRFSVAYAPLDEALSRVVVDLSGRPGLFFTADFTSDRIGTFDVQLVREFFQALVNHAMITLHIDQLKGVNCHHQVESIFKAFGLALGEAIQINPINSNTVLSTKGLL